MRVRAQVHLTDAAGQVITPGTEFDAPGDDPRIQGYLTLGYVVPIYKEPMRDELKPSQPQDAPKPAAGDAVTSQPRTGDPAAATPAKGPEGAEKDAPDTAG